MLSLETFNRPEILSQRVKLTAKLMPPAPAPKAKKARNPRRPSARRLEKIRELLAYRQEILFEMEQSYGMPGYDENWFGKILNKINRQLGVYA